MSDEASTLHPQPSGRSGSGSPEATAAPPGTPGHGVELFGRLFASALVDMAPDGLAVVDQAGALVFLNERMGHLFGYAPDELVGEPVERLVPDELRAVHERHRESFRAEPRMRAMGAGLVLYGRRKDGSELPVEISLSPMTVGRDVFVVASVRDVTARVAAEAPGRAIQELLDAATDAMLIFDRHTLRFTYVNEGAVRQLGYSKDELLAMTQLDIKPEVTEAEYRRMIDNLAPGEAVTFATVHRRKDGTEVDVEVTLEHPALDSRSPAAQWLVSVARDVSDRLATERQLLAAQRELAVLDDRRRIARELHDRVIQRLFAAGLAASSVSGRLDDEVARTRVEQVVSDLDEAITDLRSSIFQLAPPGSERSLRARVLDLCAKECDALDIRSNVRFLGPVDTVPPTRAEELLAVLREALANVARHAHASSVDVEVSVNGGVALSVIDDGVGLAATERNHLSHGLANMAARARSLGGSFAVRAEEEAGTRVEWRVPGV